MSYDRDLMIIRATFRVSRRHQEIHYIFALETFQVHIPVAFPAEMNVIAIEKHATRIGI